MEDELFGGLVAKNEAFSTATLIYTRLRRVTGRVLDAAYLAENTQYVQHVAALIQATGDVELLKLLDKLKTALGIGVDVKEIKLDEKKQNLEIKLEPSYQATEEEVYKAQVSHHYIGSLR